MMLDLVPWPLFDAQALLIVLGKQNFNEEDWGWSVPRPYDSENYFVLSFWHIIVNLVVLATLF